ncbi:alpha/beta hydrolase [Nocardioides sp. LHG3406-4]|uniref:alpha/beta hydrolase n=1 Tax=Nocardioides sp. LHG3406-4 TaxID=2804575 RepID=UPI003CF34676
MSSVLPTAAPFSAPARPELTGGRPVGVLLSHGFTGSPASMRPWGEALAERGYAVEVPRLPGHGTSWQEMNTTTWSDWYAEVSRSFDLLVAGNDSVVVGGLSMGGGLALRLAADHPDQVAGVVLVNAAVATMRKDVLALPVLKWFVRSFPGIANDIKKHGVQEHGYVRTPLRAAHSMMANWKPLRADLATVTAPVLFFKSTEDHVVDPLSLQLIRSGVSSTDFTVRSLDDSYHVATLDNEAEAIYEESAAFIARVTAPAAG